MKFTIEGYLIDGFGPSTPLCSYTDSITVSIDDSVLPVTTKLDVPSTIGVGNKCQDPA